MCNPSGLKVPSSLDKMLRVWSKRHVSGENLLLAAGTCSKWYFCPLLLLFVCPSGKINSIFGTAGSAVHHLEHVIAAPALGTRHLMGREVVAVGAGQDQPWGGEPGSEMAQDGQLGYSRYSPGPEVEKSSF